MKKVAYAIIDKRKPRLNVNDIYSNKRDAVLLKTEKWVTVTIQTNESKKRNSKRKKA